ncbi:MAG: cytochrome c oxidase subunit II [Vulcanimicrobiaceae bacterium]
MNPWGPFLAFIVVGIAWTIAWGWTIAHAGRSAPYDPIVRASAQIRRRLFTAVTIVFVAGLLVSVWWFPYRSIAAARLGSPATKIAVTASMWHWNLSQTQIPAGTVEFDVTSVDVNHGFGIYAPSGHLVAQVQAMPGYTNHLIVSLVQTGRYTVRCLEYCGVPHIYMTTTFQVR